MHCADRPTRTALAGLRRCFAVRAPEGIAVVFGASLADRAAGGRDAAGRAAVPARNLRGSWAALREGRIDLDIGSFRTIDPETRTQVLSEQALVGAARAGHPLLKTPKKTPITAERFAAARHVGVVRCAPGESSPVDTPLAELGLQRQVAQLVPSTFSAADRGLANRPGGEAHDEPARGMAASLGLMISRIFDTTARPRNWLLAAVHDDRERIDLVAVEQDVDLHHVRGADSLNS